MLFKTVALLSALTLAVNAHPAAPAVQELNERSSSYTCGNAYDDCQGSGQGNYVCWGDNKSKTWGRWGGNDMSMHTPPHLVENIR